MAEDIAPIIANAEDHMTKAIGHLEAELIKVKSAQGIHNKTW